VIQEVEMIPLETFQLSRKKMAELLISLKSEVEDQPLAILKEVWLQNHRQEVANGKSVTAFIETEMPPIFEKIINIKKRPVGFSINEIVSLGNQIEFTNLSSTAVQNWVKRDVKELIGSPQLGKKYSVDQAAILLIVEDLKASLDFESIRKILTLVFNNPDDRTDDIINPIDFYGAYSAIFDKIHHYVFDDNYPFGKQPLNTQIEQFIKDESFHAIQSFHYLNDEQTVIVLNILVISSLTVQSTYYQALTRKHATAALFLHGF
jgi:hypothetical protein